MKQTTTKLGVLAFLGLGLTTYAQQGKVGINAENPQATLEIKVADANTSGNTKEGVLIPRVSRVRAANMGADVAESTLLYIDSVSDGAASGTTVNVDATGFYFFKGGVWVKMGAGASQAGVTLNTITGKIREVVSITPEEWAKPNTFALVQTSGDQIGLPDPANYIGKIISVNNQYNNRLEYSEINQPKKIRDLDAGKGHLLMSGIDTTNGNKPTWFVIGGSY
ncbi:hypothetical protein [Riemerella columbina]|uniref:hypothetical protein n=1 Tax=Riemerella columbina TaxID=103810 RepID=UPI000382C693|nr:hypothetical protein [Riemerella columbina]